jgi:hypothetical protein
MTKQKQFVPITLSEVALFGEYAIRRERHNDERRFSVIDVIGVLT